MNAKAKKKHPLARGVTWDGMTAYEKARNAYAIEEHRLAVLRSKRRNRRPTTTEAAR